MTTDCWQALREREFPICREWVFLNHAAVAPVSARACAAMQHLAAQVRDHGTACGGEWQQTYRACRVAGARLMHAAPEDLALLKNTTEGIATVANGLAWRQGDNVVSCNVEFPANIYPWLNLARRGVELRLVPEKAGRIDFDDVAAAVDARTRVVSLSYVEFGSGFRNDLARLGELCRQRGVWFVVDAIQGLGALPVDVAAQGIHALAADGHKWLLGPEGCALFYCSPDLRQHLEVATLGWWGMQHALDFLNYEVRLRSDSRRFECGTLNTIGVYGLTAALELLLEVGVERIEERILKLTDCLCEHLASKGAAVFSSRREGEKSGIVSFTAPGVDPRAFVTRAKEAGIIVAEREGRIRVSPHFYNSTADLDALLTLL